MASADEPRTSSRSVNHVLPEPFTARFLSQLETLRLRARKEFLGGHTGSYASPRRGSSLEFADYRRYAPGDDLRYLDWGIYARTDRLYVKLFREEVDLFAYVFIDASASMAFPSVEEKFLPASHIAAALSYVVLANHDHVKIHLLREPSTSISSPFYRGRRRMVDCVQFTANAVPEGTMNMAASLAQHLQKLRRPGKALLISDFLMPPASYQQGLNLLRAFNLDIAVIQVLTRQEVEPPFESGGVNIVDAETSAEMQLRWDVRARQEYQTKLAQHNSEIRSFCHQSGIHYSLYITDRDFSGFIFTTLRAIGLCK